MTTQVKKEKGRKQSNTAKHPSVKRRGRTSSRQEARERPDLGLKEHPLVQLQRSHGNQAVQRVVSERIQPKLEVGHPNDKYEREADRVAERVMEMPEPGTVERAGEGELGTCVQRMCTRCQSRFREGKPLNCTDCEQEVQRKETGPENPSPSGDVERQIQSSRGGGRPLPKSARSTFEPRFGSDFSDVRVHDGQRAAELNRALNAQAFTYGRDIFFGSGNYSYETSDGQKLLAHELTHVQQQRQFVTIVTQRQPNSGASTGQKIPPGENLQPPGDCSQKVYDELNREKNRLCSSADRGCKIGDSLDVIDQKIARTAACIAIRYKIMNLCFRGGDIAHQEWVVEQEIKEVLRKCHEVKKSKEERKIWDELGQEERARKAKRVAEVATISGALGVGAGAIIGGTFGALGGGAGGTLVFPGVGTIGGGVAGAAAGATEGALVGGAAGVAIGGGLQALYELVF